jgi:cell wall-associated NlpC family hydrolase
VPASAQTSSLAGKRAQAASLQARIAAQGRRLSIADENYNQARLARRAVDAKLAAARAREADAERRWRGLRERLGGRVRALYMHPGAPLDAWLGVISFSEESRAAVLSRSIINSDTELVHATEQARNEVRRQAGVLGSLRARAQRAEQEMEAKRSSVAGEIAAQRALLRQVNGDIARIMEAERKRTLDEAARVAAAEAAAAATPPPSSPPGAVSTPPPVAPPPTQSTSGAAAKAVSTARAQIGKPYEWSASGPNSFDCSGLTMYSWHAAGVDLPHSSQAQYDSLPKVSRANIRPGDLLFFGSPIHHVGIYEGGGVMINAPETGENVRRDAIARSGYAGAARPG